MHPMSVEDVCGKRVWGGKRIANKSNKNNELGKILVYGGGGGPDIQPSPLEMNRYLVASQQLGATQRSLARRANAVRRSHTDHTHKRLVNVELRSVHTRYSIDICLNEAAPDDLADRRLRNRVGENVVSWPLESRQS